MSGIFGVVSEDDCSDDLYYGTDYNSHLGTKRGGLAVLGKRGIERKIHNIENDQFRSKFADDLPKMNGNSGVGVISDYEDQPLTIGSRHGEYALVSVSKINNLKELADEAFRKGSHFIEMSGGKINPTEVIANIINQENTIEAGIERVQESVNGSCTLMMLTSDGIYAARDKFGRTPLVIGKKEKSYAASSESCAFPNLDYRVIKELGPGEIVLLTKEGMEQKKKAGSNLKICSFLWIYYGNPTSSYEGKNVETTRYRCGAAIAKRDSVDIDIVAGIPDSGVAHAKGYAMQRGLSDLRPLVKYVQTWQRSFMPQEQRQRDLVAKMKIIPVPELIKDKKLLFLDDSIVRGTQLRDKTRLLFDYGAKEVHIRPACPPLTHGCKFLGFSRSRSEQDLAARRAIEKLEGNDKISSDTLLKYSNPDSDNYHAMVDVIKDEIGVTSLQYQRLDDLKHAIGINPCNLCTYCWNGHD